ncbi:MmgE/PrpD family protein [Modestobacter sp. Leaf380]|uniref:MmgE/PrpD family protein n=1 Tax=Modestobacter sp. Leaf380 TaxID=1736356 RepID=UPI0006F1CB5B|nr:MmgE/PrpD family protein [Modestobacter sp. Leaf380]KQS64281.1 MmgE/PrpD family protein [Modestobacter sp. Leaf380]
MPTTTDDVVHHFAAAAAGVHLDDVPPPARDAAKKSVLDTLGVMLAASGTEPAVRSAVDLVVESGGNPEASVVAFGHRTSAVAAAFANGALAHSLDFDDQTPWGQHASSTVVPAAFAVAERRGGVSGADLVAAVAAGQDLFARLRCTVGWRKDWNLSTVLGVYAGTVAAGRVLGLSAASMADALGIASQQSSGVMEVVCGTGGDLRGMYAGFSARGAVTAALMAQKGTTAVGTLMEGEYGVFATYFGGRYDRAAMLEDLGVDFRGAGTLYKRWPAVGTAHSHVHATIEAMREGGLGVDDVAQIRVFVGDYHALMCEPLDTRRAPSTLVDAKFSLPWLVAVAAVHGDIGLQHLTGGALRDPAVLAAAQKVVPVPDAAADWHLELPPGRVELVGHDGRRHTRTGTGVPGNTDAPLSWADLGEKFAGCARVAATPPGALAVDRVVDMVRHLEEVSDVAAVVRALG